jgi:putative RecB family exonuclease
MYEYQMYVYAELYRARNGVYPAKAVLYFLNELSDGPRPSVRPYGALYEVPLDAEHIREAMSNFEATVQAIEESLRLHSWEVPSAAHDPGDETCDICDIRWSCSLKGGRYPRRYP